MLPQGAHPVAEEEGDTRVMDALLDQDLLGVNSRLAEQDSYAFGLDEKHACEDDDLFDWIPLDEEANQVVVAPVNKYYPDEADVSLRVKGVYRVQRSRLMLVTM